MLIIFGNLFLLLLCALLTKARAFPGFFEKCTNLSLILKDPPSDVVMLSSALRSTGRGLVRAAASSHPSSAGVVSPAFRCSSDYAGTDAGEFSAPADSYMPEPQVKRSTFVLFLLDIRNAVFSFSERPRDGEVPEPSDPVGARRPGSATTRHGRAPRRHLFTGDQLQVCPVPTFPTVKFYSRQAVPFVR